MARRILKINVLVIVILLCTVGTINSQSYDWFPCGTGNQNGTNGNIYALAYFNNKIVVAGSFTQAGGIAASNIAAWNGNSWEAFGTGLNDTVYALSVYNGELVAGGKFTNTGASSHIARWTGSSWVSLGNGADDEVKALLVYNSQLIAGGNFSNPAENIASWNGTAWGQLGTGMDDDVYALTIYNSNLVAAGKFTNAGGSGANRIASWNGSAWSAFGSGLDERVFALTVYNSNLIAGGRFTTAGGIPANNLALWNGTSWSAFPVELNDRVFALAVYNNELVAGGSFKFAGSLYVDRIAKWNGSAWARMVTGMNEKVNALLFYDYDTTLYAGGEFTTAGGKWANHCAFWKRPTTSTVTGEVRYADNNQLVLVGKVRALRLDVNTKEVIVVDSANISNGIYLLPRVPIDTIFVISFPSDELEDNFVPTYHPSTLDWMSAVRIYPIVNLSNINIFVIRATPGPQSPLLGSIGGYVYLNLVPPQFQPGYPYSSDAIVYARQSGIYRKFAISNTQENYILPNLQPGTYDLFVNRLGYTSDSRTVVLGAANLDTINFTLDTTSIIGIQNIGSDIPGDYELKQNYPNPFNPSTTIEFSISKESFVELRVYNILGQKVAELLNEELKPGIYRATLNASRLPSGVYFYRLSTSDFSESRKMVLIK